MTLPYTQLRLPNKYAQILLQRQINVKLAIEPLQNNLCKLLEMYSLGFQYYESIGSYKYRYFQQRMKEVFIQQEETSQKNAISQAMEKNSPLSLLSGEQLLRIDRKSLDEQRVSLLRQIQERTSIKSTNQEIKSLLLKGDYKAIDLYTRVKFEIDFQEKILQQKLQSRHRKSVRNQSKKGFLKLNSTKTSLLSVQSKRGEQLSEIKENIFQKLINQNQEEDVQPNKQVSSLKESESIFVYEKQGNSQ